MIDAYEPDPRPGIEAKRQEYVRLEAEADRLGAGEYAGPVPEGHPAYEAEQTAVVAWMGYLEASRTAPEAGS